MYVKAVFNVISISVSPDWDFSSGWAWISFFSLWSFSRSLQLLCCFTFFHSIDESFTVMAAGAGHLPKRARASILPHSCPLTQQAGIHPLSMHALLCSATVAASLWRDDCCTLLAGKLNCIRLTRQLTAISMHDWATTHFTASPYHCYTYKIYIT